MTPVSLMLRVLTLIGIFLFGLVGLVGKQSDHQFDSKLIYRVSRCHQTPLVTLSPPAAERASEVYANLQPSTVKQRLAYGISIEVMGHRNR